MRAYIRKVWEGWKWAQACITGDLWFIHMSRAELQKLGKDARKNHDKGSISRLDAAIKSLNHRESILRMIANSMVWTMFGAERWKVRWLWTGTPPVSVTSIGYETSTFVDDINVNPDSVALMTDITSLAGIGDVLVVDEKRGRKRPIICELKAGSTNSQIVSLVEEYHGNIEQVPPGVLDALGPHAQTHFERVARQVERKDNFESIINNDIGKDPETGVDMQNIGEEAMNIDTYDSAFGEMMFTAAKSGSVIECIDGCLWIGIYYAASFQDKPWENFRQDILDLGASGSSRVWNIQSASLHPRMQPIFLRNLHPESILDILLGDALVLVYIDWDTFFQQANYRDISARWTTRRERKEITEIYGRLEQAFRGDGYTPVFSNGESKYLPLGGAAQRIVVEGTSPHSVLQMVEEGLRLLSAGGDLVGDI
ncbi:MAG: hypothetical protein OXC95_02885 [Dehalococcoidia bacterium]|nr:hypothetical protein [Dehalococcoidia bacterium]